MAGCCPEYLIVLRLFSNSLPKKPALLALIFA
jgi:hypothetical protein